jgi:hypothetical protein
MGTKWKFDMFGTKSLYGKYSTKNIAYNVQRNTRFISYSVLRTRESDGMVGREVDFLE